MYKTNKDDIPYDSCLLLETRSSWLAAKNLKILIIHFFNFNVAEPNIVAMILQRNHSFFCNECPKFVKRIFAHQKKECINKGI